jgi:hypothetical protein
MTRASGPARPTSDGTSAPVRRRRRLVRRLGAGTALTVVAAAALAGADWSQAAGPEQVLQAVNINLGSNGAIAKVESTDIRKDLPGYQSTTMQYAPAAVAGSLPVGVSLSYLHNGVAGTDLSSLARDSGLVEVDVTITNKTVKPVELSYPVDGTQRSQQALVGTPLTVTATATLPKGSFGRIVQAAPGTTDPHTTNGVVSANDKGATTVSWAALLAPPSLTPTTTFALVEQADHFALPTFDIAVTPGLNADPSVTGLLTRTFGASNSLLATQDQAISLVDQVNATLGAVSSNLGQIQSALSSTASGVGQAATALLAETGDSISASADQLSSELTDLQSTVGGSISSAGGSAGTTLAKTVAGLVAYIGLPNADASGGGQTAALRHRFAGIGPALECQVTTTAGATPTTLLGQLQQVATLLGQIGSTSTGCIQQTSANLAALIGTPTTTCTPLPVGEPTPVVCTIAATKAVVDADAGSVGSGVSALEPDLTNAASALSTVQASLVSLGQGLQQEIGTVSAGGTVATAGSALQAFVTAFESPTGPLATVHEELTPLLAPAGPLGSLSVAAGTEIAALGVEPAGTGSRQRVADTVAAACLAEPTADDTVIPGATTLTSAATDEYVSFLLAGTDCEGDAPGSVPVTNIPGTAAAAAYAAYVLAHAGNATPVEQQLSADAAAWQGVSTTATGLQQALTTLQTDLDPTTGKLATALAALPTSSAVGTALRQLDVTATALAGLGAPAGTECTATTLLRDVTTACLGTGTTPAAGSLQQLLAALGGTQTSSTAAADAALDAADLATTTAGTSAATSLAGLVAHLTAALDAVSTAQLAQGTAALEKQQALLLQQQAQSTETLDAGTAAALAQLNSSLGAAGTAQSSASAALTQLVSEVDTDLGSGAVGSNTGILGAIQSNATLTSAGSEQIDQAAAQASDFKGVRLTDVANNLLVQQQLQAAMAAAAAFPAFGPALPAGSTHTTVFVFHLAAIG